MAFEKAAAFLREHGYSDRILTFDVSSATVELAAQAIGTELARIAKSLTFAGENGAVMVIAAGDARIDNPKYKAEFGRKAKMLSAEEVRELIGHEVGGVCPFGIHAGVKICLDVSLKRFDVVYPACGSAASAVRLTPAELEALLPEASWVDVCRLP